MSENQPSSNPEPLAQSGGSAEVATAEEVESSSPALKHPMLVYSMARLLMLVACLAVIYLLGARGIVWLIVSFLISALLSYIFLAKLRDQVGAGVGRHFDKLNSQVAQGEVNDNSPQPMDANSKATPVVELAETDKEPNSQ